MTSEKGSEAPEDSRSAPGPWKDRIATGTCDHMISGQREAICVIPFKYGTPESRNANARLIAAAPELLEACKRFIEAFESPDFDGRASNADVQAGRAAIAKAQGEKGL